MKITNAEIFVAREPLEKLMEIRLPVRVSYQVAQLVHKVNDQLKIIEDVRRSLVQTYGAKKENGQLEVLSNSPEFQKFADEFNELMQQEIELNANKIKLPEKVSSTCDKCHHNMDRLLEIEPKIIMALESLIEIG